MTSDIRCSRCGKLLARDMGNRLEVKGKPSMTVYAAACLGITCDRCGQRVDMPVTMESGERRT